MTVHSSFVVDFVARGATPDEWRMVLVEQGPWAAGKIEAQLRRLQDRLYDCVDAAIDGQLANQFPDSRGKRVVVQVDGYDLPSSDVSQFFDRFSEGALRSAEYKSAVDGSPYVSGIVFELNLSPDSK